ncbi:MAG: hypothetical protein LBL63_04960, partial [Clostridiales Family XIII bacterium]|nr:hypothetical protein [Clostridiales Family XIII bacterium]
KLTDRLRRGTIDVDTEVFAMLNTGLTVGFLEESCDWIRREAELLADSGYAGRLYWDLPPEIITMDELIEETDKYRSKDAPKTNNDSSIWIPDEYERGLTSEQWNGPSRKPSVRLAVYRAKADDPEAESAADPILHGLQRTYDEQLELVNEYIEEFNRDHTKYKLEALTHKGVATMLLADRINGVPIGDRILSKGFMRVMYGWWRLYGNANAPRCGSVTLSTDWFIMNESAGHAYPNDGFGLSMRVAE